MGCNCLYSKLASGRVSGDLPPPQDWQIIHRAVIVSSLLEVDLVSHLMVLGENVMLAPLPALDGRGDQLLGEHIRDLQAPSPEEVRRLVYEIELRESNLEQQNEELRKIQQHLEAYKDRYVDLYDFAPLGYATLDGDGYLQEINLAGAKMLGAERAALTGYAFGECVAKDDQQAFLDHLRECARERHEVTSELRLVATGGQSIAVQLRSIPIDDENTPQRQPWTSRRAGRDKSRHHRAQARGRGAVPGATAASGATAPRAGTSGSGSGQS